MNRFTATAFMVVLGLNANAQTDSITGKTHLLGGVEVCVHDVNTNVVEAVPMQTLSQKQFSQFGIVSLADAVKKFAGATVRDYGGIGGMKTVSVRNLGAFHTALSYDGVTISDTQAGQVDVGRFSLDNVKMVSLAVGQNDDCMQSARHYASAGVLSVETEKPYFVDKDWALRLRTRGGSFGYVCPSVRYWQRLTSRTSLSVDGTYMRADGDYPFTLINGRKKSREERVNSDIFSWQGETNIFHVFRDSSEIQVKAYYYYSDRGLPGSVILYNNDATERLWDENFFTQTVYSKTFGEWQFKGRLKYTHSWNRYEDVNVKYPNGRQLDVNRQNEYYSSATIGWRPLDGLSVALAEDFFISNLSNNILGSSKPTRYTSLTALSARCKLGRLLIDGNIVGTFAEEHTDKGGKFHSQHRLSPSVAFSYRLLDDESLFVRALVKSTFRMPSFNDLYYLRIGNVNLNPEKALEYNAGLTWSGLLLRNIGVLLTVDGYFNAVHDKIVAFPTTYVWRMINYGKVHITGIDVTAAVNVPLSSEISAQMSLAYTLQKAIDKTNPEKSTYNVQIPYTPENSGSISASLNTPLLVLGYTATACGERYCMSQNTSEYRLAPYWEHSVTVSHEFVFKHSKLLLSGSMLNITDEQYEIVKYYPMPGRNWQLSLTWSL